MNSEEPFIKPSTILPETTGRAILLGFVLALIMSAANAYLGLLLGMTVSASIPAAVISMALLRFFRNNNILENNIVQTAASSGEALAAGVIFTFPALVLMGYWQQFNYWETTLISLSGGALGVLFTIPLRNALIIREKLKFPEGMATAEVLKAGNKGGAMLKYLIQGSLLGSIIKLVVDGFKLWGDKFQVGALVNGKIFLYFGTYLTPAVVAVGYIVGLNIATLVFMGGALSWYLAIPGYIAINGAPADVDAVELGKTIWSTKVRYLGVGAMIVGGIWAVISISGSLKAAAVQGWESIRKPGGQSNVIRTERDMSFNLVFSIIAVLLVAIFIIYYKEVDSATLAVFMTALMVIAGFLFSAVAGYMAGLVGSSNNPISGVTISTILLSALLLAALVGTTSAVGAASAIMIGAVVCCAAAMAGDNMQDLKSGHLLGATPRKQQYAQFVGVFAGAIVLAPVMNLLHSAYGLGSEKLSAPQASLMRSVAEGVFGGNLPWNIITAGGVIGALIIVCDSMLKRRNSSFRMPVLAVAVGMYLPFYLDMAIFIGGIIAWLVNRFFKKHEGRAGHEAAKASAENAGLLFASGLITGEAILGIMLAIPIALTKDADALKFFGLELPGIVGFAVLVGCCVLLYHSIRKAYFQTSKMNE